MNSLQNWIQKSPTNNEEVKILVYVIYYKILVQLQNSLTVPFLDTFFILQSPLWKLQRTFPRKQAVGNLTCFPQEGLTDDDYDMYYEIWQQFDPNGTQYIKYNQLSDFLDVLESPLQIHKPNKYKIISMDIPICKGDLCFCVDVLDALTKDFFARKGNPVEETAELGEQRSSHLKVDSDTNKLLVQGEVTAQADRPGYDPISSTLWRQREEYCARMIQVFAIDQTAIWVRALFEWILFQNILSRASIRELPKGNAMLEDICKTVLCLRECGDAKQD